jgi:serine/threonine-protein kinase
VDDLVGRTLGRYEVTALVGRGGMATVYKARHPGLNRNVAVKVLHRHLAVDSAFVGRFRREARAVATLRHPNIVRLHDFDNEGDIYFIVMEFIDGPTLASFLKRLFKQGRHLSPQEILRLFSPLCSAIDYAHQQGMVHRDIKPSNIILTRQHEPILTDYGIARIAGATAYTIPGVVIGSAHYMSPEQAEGLPGDNRSDIYSLGIVLFEALTGSVPFQGDTPLSVLMKQVSSAPPPALSLNPDLPPAIEAVVNKALAKDPNDRYQKASDLALALQEVFGEAAAEPAAAVEAGAVEEPTLQVTRQITPPPPSAGEATRAAEPTLVTEAEAGLTIPPAPARRARAKIPRQVMIPALALAVVAVAVGGFLLFGGGGGSSQPAGSTSASTQVTTATPTPSAGGISDDDLASMVPTKTDLGEDFSGYQESAGLDTNEQRLEDMDDPDHERSDQQTFGRVTGYGRTLQASTVQADAPFLMHIGVTLFEDSEGASGSLNDGVKDVQANVGRTSLGLVLEAVDPFQVPPLGDESLGLRGRASWSPDQGEPQTLYVTNFWFRRDRIIGGVTLVQIDDADLSQQTQTIASLLDERIQQILAGLATPIPTAAAIATPTPPDLSSFAKGWGRHGFGLTIDANGQGSAIWRVYKWCSDDPTPPCDAVVENQIISGGSATLAFDRVDGATAFGRVLSSNDESMFPLDSEVLLTLLPYDMATLRHGLVYETTLCGPDYADLAPQSLRETLPCGA